jgi:hypothetical protein
MALSGVNKAFDQVKKRLQIGSNERDGLIDLYPAPPPQARFQPIVEHYGHMHQVDLDLILFIVTPEAVAAQRPAFQTTDQARFLLCFSDGCIARPFALIEGTFGEDPPFTTWSRHEGDFDTVVADAKGYHCCLAIQSRHFHQLSDTGLLTSRTSPPTSGAAQVAPAKNSVNRLRLKHGSR